MTVKPHPSFAVNPDPWLRADTLMRMQAAYDLAQVRARAGTIEVERVAA